MLKMGVLMDIRSPGNETLFVTRFGQIEPDRKRELKAGGGGTNLKLLHLLKLQE